MSRCQNSNCDKEFNPGKNTRGMYCSRSCAVTVNNKLHQKRPKNPKTICKCGGFKHTQSLQCHKCKKQEHYDIMMTKPIRDYICSHPEAKARFNSIRKWARDTMERYGPEKKCRICGFDIIVQVCHIKGIAEFSEDALMGEVNALDNLVYLCPNHHGMLDLGLLEL